MKALAARERTFDGDVGQSSEALQGAVLLSTVLNCPYPIPR